MRQVWLKSAAVVAAGLMGSIGWAQTSWTYSDTDKTVTDGKWVIAVTAYDSAAGTMTLGAITTAAEDGVLDLRDMVVGNVAITGLTMPESEAWKSAAIKELYVNKVVGPLAGKTTIQLIPSMLKGNTTVQVVELASDTIQKINSSPRAFEGCSALGRVVFKCPNLLSWAHEAGGSGSPFQGTVVSNAFHDIVNPWVTDVGNAMFSGLGQGNGYSHGGVTGPVILTNLVTCNGSPFHGGGTLNWNKLTEFRIKWPHTYGLTLWNSFPAVTNFVFEAPNLKSYGSIMKFTSLEQDIATLLPPYVQTIGRRSLEGMSKLYGKLVLTNLVSMSAGNNSSAAFDCEKVKAAEFRGPITNIPYQVMSYSLTNLVLQLPNVTNVCARAFLMANNGELTIYGKPWAENLRTNLLARIAAPSNAKATTAPTNLVLKVSKKQGWKEYAGKYDDTDFPEANKPEGCFGVWREPFGTGTRGAWMVHFPQPDDPTGLC